MGTLHSKVSPLSHGKVNLEMLPLVYVLLSKNMQVTYFTAFNEDLQKIGLKSKANIFQLYVIKPLSLLWFKDLWSHKSNITKKLLRTIIPFLRFFLYMILFVTYLSQLIMVSWNYKQKKLKTIKIFKEP